MTAWSFFIEHRGEIVSATLDHIGLVLIAMLIVRPWGLFGTREELDRV